MELLNEKIIGLEFTNGQGKQYKIIKEAERRYGKRYFVVRFLESGTEVEARLDNIMIGNVGDKNNRTCIKSRQDPTEFIGFSGITKLGDEFEVIGYAGKRKKAHMYTVKFKESGSEKDFEKASIQKCLIRDPIRSSDYSMKNFEGVNTQGEKFKVLGLAYIKDGNKLYNVQFEDTGYVGQFYKQYIIKGKIKDIYYPSFLGVACIGNVQSTAEDSPCRNEYVLWCGMINRCYNVNHKSYINYGAKGVTVCERWRCFEYFLEDIVLVENYDKWKANHTLYHLDKDKKQQDVENKVYSLETCQFISVRDNTLDRNIRMGNKTGFIGVAKKSEKTYSVMVNTDYYGSFASGEAAANIYNHVARYRGYPEEYLNTNIPYMSRLECGNYRIHNSRNALVPMIYILDKQRESAVYTDVAELPQMIKVINTNKYNNL